MKNRSLKPAIFVLNLLLNLPAETMAMPNMQAIDTNNDGQVSSTEVQTSMTALFAKIDTNSDGFISLVESESRQEAAGAEHFTQLDTDSNSALTVAEFQAGAPQQADTNIAARLFNLLDNDKNSALSWDEFSVMEPGKGHMLRNFAEMDTDGDSQVSQAEFLAQRPHHPGHPHGGPNSKTAQ